MISKQESESNGLFVLLKAAHSLGDHPGSNRHHHIERNDLHEYARSPTERDHSAKEPRVREKKSEDRVHIEPKERQRPGGRLEHNRLEKDRRAQLKENFNRLKEAVPSLKDKKASNQAILKGTIKYIHTFKQDEEKQMRVMQNLSAEKIEFMKQLSLAKEKFEEKAGYSAEIYLRENMQDDTDMDSISTLSATEGPENMEDVDMELKEMSVSSSSVQTVDLEEQPGPQVPPSSQEACSKLRGIPHSVIKPVPGNHRLEAEGGGGGGTLSGVHRATLKKVQAKITSTKQPAAPSPHDGSERIVVATTSTSSSSSAVQQVIVTPPSTFQQPALPTYSPAALSAGNVTRVAMPRRMMGHSLLGPGPLVPIFHTTSTTTTAPVTSVVVPTTVQAGHTLLPTEMPRLRSVNSFFESRHLIPQTMYVADPMSLFMKQPVPSVIVVSSPLPSASTNPAVSSNVAL